ncbi:hypothetical protein Trihar35433_8811 [Trichoderma harzianum]|nr:hypothetical protein Trihar35433_8811 [Trichoderma harzianum]
MLRRGGKGLTGFRLQVPLLKTLNIPQGILKELRRILRHFPNDNVTEEDSLHALFVWHGLMHTPKRGEEESVEEIRKGAKQKSASWTVPYEYLNGQLTVCPLRCHPRICLKNAFFERVPKTTPGGKVSVEFAETLREWPAWDSKAQAALQQICKSVQENATFGARSGVQFHLATDASTTGTGAMDLIPDGGHTTYRVQFATTRISPAKILTSSH